MTNPMIEKVARAIAANNKRGLSPDAPEVDAVWHSYCGQARAAIEAMREPSRRMLRAACKAMSPGRRPTPERVSVREKHGIRYRAMIDEVLTDGEAPDLPEHAQFAPAEPA
jgi:hypothetical protein